MNSKPISIPIEEENMSNEEKTIDEGKAKLNLKD